MKPLEFVNMQKSNTMYNHKGCRMSHVINMHRPGGPRWIAVSDLCKIIPCLVTPRFEQTTLAVRAKQYYHSVTGFRSFKLHPGFNKKMLMNPEGRPPSVRLLKSLKHVRHANILLTNRPLYEQTFRSKYRQSICRYIS
jgi:hypothetical protein